jgi:site-specific recombinase XerD
LRRADARARAEAVARGEKEPQGITQGWGLHSLRHFFATSLIHRGASVKTVQLALGHSKPSITLDTYTHEWPDVTERTRTLMEDALRVGVEPTRGSTSVGS